MPHSVSQSPAQGQASPTEEKAKLPLKAECKVTLGGKHRHSRLWKQLPHPLNTLPFSFKSALNLTEFYSSFFFF